MNCEFCQKPTHIWFDCPTKPAGWRPARLAKKSTGATARAAPNHRGSQVAQAVEQGAASVIARDSSCASSTLALPVDTRGEGVDAMGTPRAATVATPSTPAKFDKKAWMREYMRDHRKGILRRPEPTTKREKDE